MMSVQRERVNCMVFSQDHCALTGDDKNNERDNRSPIFDSTGVQVLRHFVLDRICGPGEGQGTRQLGKSDRDHHLRSVALSKKNSIGRRSRHAALPWYMPHAPDRDD